MAWKGYRTMISDPLEAFRRAAAATLARMEHAFVERALMLQGLLVGEAVSGARRVVANNAQLALDAVQMLVRLPHHLADMLADSWRGPDARVLTVRERLAIADAYGYRARPDLLRIVNGPGLSSIPRAAFENGNPAITIGNTIYLRPASNWPKKDLMTKPEGAALLMHEVMHTIQYREMGYSRFAARYGADMTTVRGKANEMYKYGKRRRQFNAEMIEGQAETVSDYYALLHSTNPKLAVQRAALQRRLKGTGIYGL